MSARLLHRRAVVGLAVLTTVATAAACASSSPAATTGTSARSVPATASSGTTGTTSTTAPAGPTVVVPYWIRDQVVGAGEARPLAPGADPLRAALDVLLARPLPAEEAEGFSTQLQSNVSVYSLVVDGDTVTVDFSRTLETHNTQPQVAQVVFTLTQFAASTGVTKVRFLIEGQPNGAAGVPPVGRDNFDSLTPPALVDQPTPGATVPSRSIVVAGTARASITAVTWTLNGVDGPPLAQGTIAVTPPDPDATAADPLAVARGSFSATITGPEATIYSGPAFLVLDPGDPGHVPVRIPITLA